jgi:hypothetical protein
MHAKIGHAHQLVGDLGLVVRELLRAVVLVEGTLVAPAR